MVLLCPQMAHGVTRRFGLLLVFRLLTSIAYGESNLWSLGEPPQAPTPEKVLALKRIGLGLLNRTGTFVVDTSSREQVRLFHQTVFFASDGIDMA